MRKPNKGSYSETTTADTLGRLASVVNLLGTYTMAYSGNTSRATAITHSGGFDTTFTYTGPEQGRALSGILSKMPGGNTVAQHSYTYDNLGQIATWKREAPLANPGTTHQYQWTLAHDYSGQLTSAIEKDLSGGLRDGWAFGYDAAGNRQSSTRSGAPGATAQAMTAAHNTMNQITTLGGGGRTMVAGTLNEPGQVAVGIAGQGDHPARMLSGNRFEYELDLPSGTSTLQLTATDPTGNTSQKQYTVATAPQTARTVTHDADGNMTSDGVRTYEWDAWSRLTKIIWATGKTTDISYNGLGQRSKLVHTDGGTTRTEYLLYDGAELHQRRTGGSAASNTDRVYFAQGERRKVGSIWTNHHYTRDHLGSVREVLASDGTLLARYDYTPYGERETRYEASGYEGTDFGFTGHITLPSPVAGQRELVFAHFRAYDPLIGRWLSQDPIREQGGVNLYGYVGGGVVMYADPFGLKSWDEHLIDNLPGWAVDALGSTPEIPKPVLNFTAGMGDALSFGVTQKIREEMGTDSFVDPCSGTYVAGEVTAIAVGMGRTGYASAAKIASKVYKAKGTIEAAKAAVNFRNNLKRTFRLNPFSKFRIYPFETIAKKYGGDPIAIIEAAGRTNPILNAIGFAGFAGGLTNENRRSSDCP